MHKLLTWDFKFDLIILLIIFTCFVTVVLLGALLVYIRMKNEYDLLLIDLEFAEEKLQKQEQSTIQSYESLVNMELSDIWYQECELLSQKLK